MKGETMNLDTHRNLDPWHLGGVMPPGIAFETPEPPVAVAEPPAAVEPPAPAAVEPPAGAEPPAAVEPAPAAVEPPAYLTADSPAFQQVAQVSAELGRMIADAQAREEEAARTAAAPQLPELDFTDPQSILAHANANAEARMQEVLQEAMAPLQAYMPILDMVARTEGEKITTGVLADLGIPETLGEGDKQVRPREIATQLAGALMRGGMDPEQAVNQAAAQIKQFLDLSGSAAVDEHTERALALRKQTPTPGAGGTLADGPNGERPDPLRATRYTERVNAALSAQQPRQPGT